MKKIGYLSFDASIKIHRSGRFTSTKTSKTGYGGIDGYIRHIDRGTDRRNGCEVGHSNPDINPDWTLLNESYYKDENGIWQETKQSGDMKTAVERRITYAKEHGARISTKGQNDTVIARPLILQLDKEEIEKHKDTWVWDSIEIIEGMFGKDNVTGFSIHKDETNIHIHILFVPCYETQKDDGEIKCAVSQTKFFKTPRQLAGMHKTIRKQLCEKGYEIELENKPIEEQLAGYYDKNGEWHQQGLTPDQLKQLSDKEIDLQVKEIDMRLRKEEMDKLEKAMQDMQKAAKEKQEELDKDRRFLIAQQTALDKDWLDVRAQVQALAEEKAEVQQTKKEAETMLAKAYDTANVCNRILSEEKNLNGEFMKFLDREGQRTNRNVRQFVEYLYKKFQKERRDSLSSWQLEMLHLREEQKENGNVNTAPDIIDTSSSTSHYSYSM